MLFRSQSSKTMGRYIKFSDPDKIADDYYITRRNIGSRSVIDGMTSLYKNSFHDFISSFWEGLATLHSVCDYCLPLLLTMPR